MKKIYININPGIYLFLMIWWVFGFFWVSVTTYPIKEYLTSYIPYFITFAVFGLSSIALGIYEIRNFFWDKCGSWKRYFIIIGGYAGAIILSAIFIAIFDSYGLVDYFGGDAGGSFFLGHYGFFILYLIIGAVINIIISIYHKIKS